MSYHFHQPDKSSSGKWQRTAATGVARISQEQMDGWEIEITHCKVGITIARDMYNAIIRHPTIGVHESLTGFRSRKSAEAAAAKRVEVLSAMNQPTPRRLRRDQQSPHTLAT